MSSIEYQTSFLVFFMGVIVVGLILLLAFEKL